MIDVCLGFRLFTEVVVWLTNAVLDSHWLRDRGFLLRKH